jgi:hypothetical protein
VVGRAAVLASQGKLNIWWVLIVAALGAEVGGVAGYHIGDRWGPNCWNGRARGRSDGSLAALLIGLAIAAGFALLAARYCRRRRAPSRLPVPPHLAVSAPPRSAGNYPGVRRRAAPPLRNA